MEYKYRRKMFYSFYPEWNFSDDIRDFDGLVFDESTTVGDAIQYLTDGTTYQRFPGVSRAVSIAAATIVAEEFGEDFFEVLSDPELMRESDPHFVPYSQDKATYDAILNSISRDRINWNSEYLSVVKILIREEYMLDEKGLELLPRK